MKASALLKRGLLFCFWGIVVAVAAWSTLILLFSPVVPPLFRTPIAALSVCLFFAALPNWYARPFLRIACAVWIGIVVALWLRLTPSSDRNWMVDVAQAPWSEVAGDTVTIHNVRNFHYRTETDFDPVWESRSYNVNDLSNVDIIVSYWAGKSIAHVMVAFGFAEQKFLAVSIETRKEQGESYSTVAGFFRNYELVYIAADERDLLGLRTRFRTPPERVYVLRTSMPVEDVRKLFFEYLAEMNKLRAEPAFYNTLTTNCTTQVLRHVQAFAVSLKYTWKILLSGYVPELLHENGSLYPGMSLDEILDKSLINERSIAAGDSEEFSKRVREGVPRPAPRKLEK